MTVKLSPGFPTREQAPGSTKRACLNHWREVQCRKTLSVNLVSLHRHGTHACSTMYPCSYKHGYTAHEYPDRCLVSYYSGPLYGPSTCSCSIKKSRLLQTPMLSRNPDRVTAYRQGQLEATPQAFGIYLRQGPKSKCFRFCRPSGKSRIFYEHTNVPIETSHKHH